MAAFCSGAKLACLFVLHDILKLHLDSVILKQLCVDDDRIIEMYHTVILYRYLQHRTYDFHILHLPVVESYLIHQIKSCFFHPLYIV